MRHLLKTLLLDALRDSLQDVESLKLIPEDDPPIAVIRNDLRNAIMKIESDGAPAYQSDVAAQISGQKGLFDVWRSLLHNFALNPLMEPAKSFGFWTGMLRLGSINMIPRNITNGIV